jgi:Trk K+ transport system NAD-binding subunit
MNSDFEFQNCFGFRDSDFGFGVVMEPHFILCGLGRVGWRVLEHLRAVGAPIVVIDNRCSTNDARLGGVKLVAGDCRQREILEQAGVKEARAVLILTSDDLVSVSTALMVRNLNAGIRIVVRVFNPTLIARLGSAVENVFALSTSALVAPLLALLACTGKALGTFRLEDGSRQQVAELTTTSTLAGKRMTAALEPFRVHVLAHVLADGRKRFFGDVDSEAILVTGDRLLVCGEAGSVTRLLGQGESETLPELLWAGFVRRLGRVAWRTLGEVDLPVKICTAVLFSVIFLSVLIFHFTLDKDTLIDAFYRTISLIATGADMHGGDFEPGGWHKAFVGILRLIGTALIAAFTAILTNYLVRANLGGALEVRRIPDSGHIIVCGLGNVGFRVVEELIRQEERVVAIERRRDNTFISTARRLGVAVIVGDAGVAEVLRQAHGARAKAVVAATDNELANLEVTLLARELNPHQRVILRLTDPQMAQTLRQAANVRLAMSIPEMAAPAFVAALFGDRVRTLFQAEGLLLAVVDLVLQEKDPFLNHPAKVLQKDYRFLPVGLLGPDKNEKSLDTPLGTGDRLTVILPLAELQRLLHRA